MARDPQWNGWAFDFGWIWWPSGLGNPPQAGHARIVHVDSNRAWKVPIRVWDELAQKHMNDRTIKPGQPVQMPDRKVITIPYMALDDEADALLRRQMRPNSDRSPVRVRSVEGHEIKEAPRDWWEQLAATHIQRRKGEAPVALRMGNETISIGYECFDAMVKDFVRNQRDRFVAAGRWPELLIHEGVASDPKKQGPLPVQGRPDAFGQGATPALNPQKQGQPGGPVGHPALENQELV